jgi:XTP/dITP diphosphohydrolase
MELVIASNNKHKIKEITQILGNYFDKLYSLSDLGIDVEVEETGNTFYENALIKAKTISEMANMVALADDSGLMVDALNGEPGVFSARYAGPECITEENNKLLLKNMSGITDRKASFVSTIVIYFPNGKIITTTGKTDGEILFESKGTNGFGYDPLFYSYDLKKAFGESLEEEKNAISHRGRALNEMKKKLHTI